MNVSGVSTNEAAEVKGGESSSIARRLVFRLLAGLQYGRLTLKEGGRQHSFGKNRQPCAVITVHSPSVYRKVLFGGSIGAGEAYVDKLWDVDDLTTLVRIMVRNMTILDRMERGLGWLLRPFAIIRHLQNGNDKTKARQNILAHYDLGNEMYQTFLDPTMMYSSAIFPSADASLETAQQHKLMTICQKLDLQPTDNVIEIGTGWGGFAIYAARNYGCRVTTTTISDAQYQEARRRIDEAGLGERITLLQKDYRDLGSWYDKLVSIEMIEAVGHGYMPEFIKKCGDLVRPEGKMLLQAITIADQNYAKYVRGVDFIQRYIFPGGCVPSITRMVQLLSEKTDLVVRQLDDFGSDYAKTLEHWLARFRASTPLLEERGYDEKFRRLWEFYLCYCRGGFLEGSISVVHLVADRPRFTH